MPANEVKQRKKTPKQNDELSSPDANCKDETQKVKTSTSSSSVLDVRTIVCVLSVAACAFLSWVVLQQNERFSQMEDKYNVLHGQTARLYAMEEDVLKVSKKCEDVQGILDGLEGQRGVLRPQTEGLERDVGQLKQWASGLAEKRAQLLGSMTALRDAVDQIQQRTSSITQDVNNKVASVRTDVRRMAGIQSEVESLLTGVAELENKTAQAERSMVKRIGDVLAGSMDRVGSIRASSERNAQAIEQLRKRIPELASAENELSLRLRELESGRARLLKTVTFAVDLKPKVASIKRDFAGFAPQVSDLTLRIGRLAEDVTKTEQAIAELRQTLASLSAVEGDLDVTTEQVNEMTDIHNVGEMLLQGDMSRPQAQPSGD